MLMSSRSTTEQAGPYVLSRSSQDLAAASFLEPRMIVARESEDFPKSESVMVFKIVSGFV